MMLRNGFRLHARVVQWKQPRQWMSTTSPADKKMRLWGGYLLLAGGAFALSQRQYFLNEYTDEYLMPLIRYFDPETSHYLAIKAAQYGICLKDTKSDQVELGISVFGFNFSNPVGMAAGFDKNAEAMAGVLDMGYGYVEIGSVTPQPQPGNDKPRMFRLEEDRGVINRYGFNSDGFEVVAKRLKQYVEERRLPEHKKQHRPGILGVNLGKNKTSLDAAADYIEGVKVLGPYADYLVVNVSSPNTPGLRSLQGKKELSELLLQVMKARDTYLTFEDGRKTPVLVKIAPDLTTEDKKDIADVVLETKVDGLIVSNTTITRPETLQSAKKTETGGLSGAPIKDLSTQALYDMYALTKGKIPLIGVGGIANGQDAYQKIRAGASLVQMYSSLVYEGPGVVRRTKDELVKCLQKGGFASVEQAVGSSHRLKKKK